MTEFGSTNGTPGGHDRAFRDEWDSTKVRIGSSASPKPTRTTVITILATSSDDAETSLRARSVRGTRHSVIVADAGSNPAGSILQVCGGEVFILGRERRDISSK